MDKRAIFLVFGLLAASAVMAQAYRWVDDEGIVHYSDRPEPGAERIILPASNATRIRTYGSPRAAEPADNTPVAANFKYDSLNVATPGAEETLWNIEGVLSVSLALEPGLQPGHQVRVYFDGGEPQVMSSTSFQIGEVFRGVHNIQAEIIDANGLLMIRSRPNRFYVQQNAIGR